MPCEMGNLKEKCVVLAPLAAVVVLLLSLPAGGFCPSWCWSSLLVGRNTGAAYSSSSGSSSKPAAARLPSTTYCLPHAPPRRIGAMRTRRANSAHADDTKSTPNDTNGRDGQKGKLRQQQQQQAGVSQVFNRALGSILSTGDIFGGDGGGRVGLGRENFRKQIGGFWGSFDLSNMKKCWSRGVVQVDVFAHRLGALCSVTKIRSWRAHDKF